MKPLDTWCSQELQLHRNVRRNIKISHIYFVHSWESNTLNYDLLCYVPQQHLIYPRHCLPGSFYGGELKQKVQQWRKRENANLMLDWAVICRHQTEQGCRYASTGYCGKIRKQIIKGYLFISRLQTQIWTMYLWVIREPHNNTVMMLTMSSFHFTNVVKESPHSAYLSNWMLQSGLWIISRGTFTSWSALSFITKNRKHLWKTTFCFWTSNTRSELNQTI